MTEGGFDIAGLGCGLGEPEIVISTAQVRVHFRPFDPGLLAEVERLAGVDRTELALVANENQPIHFDEIGKVDQAFHVPTGHHRGLVEYQDAALHGSLSLGEEFPVAWFL